jgi:AraC-like DNA-binding protein
MTELPNRLPQRPERRPDGHAVDVLSDVLHSVRLTGSMFFLVEARTPWITAAPHASRFTAAVLPAAQHLISYHVITEGHCWAGLEGHPPQLMEAGDILVVPHGDPYFLAGAPETRSVLSAEEAVWWFSQMAAGSLPPVVSEDGGGPERAQFICGFLGCDARPFNPILAALPPVIVLKHATRGGDRLSHLVQFALGELRQPSAGGREVLLRLSELMFIEVVRCHLQDAGQAKHSLPNWLAGLRDPVVGAALARLHRQPARAWTIESLAAEVGTSRSVLAERFSQLVGRPPMHYLTAWRMQLATRLLADARTKVRGVAEAVGYDSEAAFSRAFKKHSGVTPAAWRSAGHRDVTSVEGDPQRA